MLKGETLRKIMDLQNTLMQQTNAHEKFKHSKYFCIYILCVHPSYKEKSVDIALMNACVQVALSLKMHAIGGVFTCGMSQARARNMGFQLLSEIRYGLWLVNEQVIFDDPGRGNYSAAFMGKPIKSEENPKHHKLSTVDTDTK